MPWMSSCTDAEQAGKIPAESGFFFEDPWLNVEPGCTRLPVRLPEQWLVHPIALLVGCGTGKVASLMPRLSGFILPYRRECDTT
jgi:hypothetical protein